MLVDVILKCSGLSKPLPFLAKVFLDELLDGLELNGVKVQLAILNNRLAFSDKILEWSYDGD